MTYNLLRIADTQKARECLNANQVYRLFTPRMFYTTTMFSKLARPSISSVQHGCFVIFTLVCDAQICRVNVFCDRCMAKLSRFNSHKLVLIWTHHDVHTAVLFFRE